MRFFGGIPVENEMKRRGRGKKKKYLPFSWLFSPLYFVIMFAYMELVFHIREFGNANAAFPMLFAIPAGLLTGFFIDLFPEKIARWLRYIVSAAFMVLACVQMVYFHSFQSFMSFSFAGMGDDVFTNFFTAIMLAIWECMIPILLTFLPLVGLYFIHKLIPGRRHFNAARACLTMAFCLFTYLGALLCLPLGGTGNHSAYANFHNNWVMDLSMEKLGLLSTTGFDLRYFMFSEVESDVSDGSDALVSVTLPVTGDTTQPEGSDGPIEYGYNVIEGLDFAAMAQTEEKAKVKKIYEYLAALEPTKKNQYTGMFAGYNLIMITAESFSPQIVSQEHTPTLYKLCNSGFDFTNYWTMWPSNTTNGEYSNLTGLIPDVSKPKSDGSFVYSIKNTMNMNIANWFNAQGLTTRAYHDHNASYYKRNQTHPNIGYQVFKGKKDIGGLSGWPESDLVMMQKTVDEFINDDWFHTYYMTVSGHHNYRFGGYNTIVDKNEDLVKGLDMGEGARAYLATHIELDKALEYLIQRLEEAGKLEKTVIVITTDHYPYGLTDSQWKGLIGHKIGFGGMERHVSDLVIWNSAMETVKIDKPCTQVDVLPTLLNLFGFTYDSRLYSGMDILSDSYGLAMTANQSFITDKIVYNSRYEKVYYLDENWTMPEGYLDAYIQIVKNRFSIASNILNQDFYAKLPADVIANAQKLPGSVPGEQ